MQRLFKLFKDQIRKNIERDQSFENKVESIAQAVWPWRDRWLPILLVIVAALDFISTYLLLEFSDDKVIHEGGMLAGWALRLGGMRWLLLVDILAACVLISAAFAFRYLFSRLSFKGYSRAFYIVILLPYVLMTAAAVINNILLAFLA